MLVLQLQSGRFVSYGSWGRSCGKPRIGAFVYRNAGNVYRQATRITLKLSTATRGGGVGGENWWWSRITIIKTDKEWPRLGGTALFIVEGRKALTATATRMRDPEGMCTGYTNCCDELTTYAVRIVWVFPSFPEFFTGMYFVYHLIFNRISGFLFSSKWPKLQLSLVHRRFFALGTRISFTVLSHLHVCSDLSVITLVLSLNSIFSEYLPIFIVNTNSKIALIFKTINC